MKVKHKNDLLVHPVGTNVNEFINFHYEILLYIKCLSMPETFLKS